MAEHDRNVMSGWSGRWRPRRSRRIEVSPDFAEFLAGKLDSLDYARSLMRPRRDTGLIARPLRPGPIARAAEEAAVKNVRTTPTVTSGGARVSPEYLRFLHEEISSWEYAAAVADCAKLEGIYRAPAARFSFPKRGFPEAVIDVLRYLFVLGGFAIVVPALILVLAPLVVKLSSAVIQSAWTMSFVGVAMVLATLFSSALSPLRGPAQLVQLIQRFVSEHLAHQRA